VIHGGQNNYKQRVFSASALLLNTRKSITEEFLDRSEIHRNKRIKLIVKMMCLTLFVYLVVFYSRERPFSQSCLLQAVLKLPLLITAG